MKKFLISYLPAIFWGATVFILSAVPGDNLYMPPIWNADKFAHMGVYFVLAAFLIYGFYRSGDCKKLSSATVIAVFISICFGTLLEVLQHYVFVGRFGDVLDFLANSTGAILAGLLTWVFKNRINRLCS